MIQSRTHMISDYALSEETIMPDKITHPTTSQIVLLITGLIVVILVAITRYFTGPEFSFSLFYLVPIYLVTWFIGRWAGIVISLASALTWLLADLMMVHTYSHYLIPYINETFRLIVFLAVTFIVARLKSVLEHEKEVARTDYLTGIANRRFFFKLTNIEIKRSRRYKTPFTFVYLDLDNFKTINDCLGHHTGDTLLRTVAHTIKKNIRSTDFAARLGGDEFAILLTGTEATSAHVVIQKLQSELLHVMRQNKWPVTFSIGILTLNGASTTIDEVMKKADILMYSAKQNGKNMIKKEAIND